MANNSLKLFFSGYLDNANEGHTEVSPHNQINYKN